MSAELTLVADLPPHQIREILAALESDEFDRQLHRLEKWWRRKDLRARARARRQRRGWS